MLQFIIGLLLGIVLGVMLMVVGAVMLVQEEDRLDEGRRKRKEEE